MSKLFNAETGNLEDAGQDALQAGTHELPLMNDKGEMFSAPLEQAQQHLAEGYRQPTNAEIAQHAHKQELQTPSEQLRTGLESAASSFSMGLSDIGAKNPEDVLARRELNPWSSVAGSVLGLGAGMLTGTGEAALMETAGKGAAKLVAPLMAENALGRIGTTATKLAIENMVFQAGDEASKAFLHDPNQTLAHSAMEVGVSGLFGGALGAAGKGASELWQVGPGSKITQTLDAIKNRGSGLDPALKTAAGLELAPEIEAALGGTPEAKQAASTLFESSSKSGDSYRSALDNFKQQSSDAIMNAVGKTPDALDALKDKSAYETGKELASSLSDSIKQKVAPIAEKYEALESQFKNAPITPEIRLDIANKVTQAITDQGLLKGQNEPALKAAQDVLSNLDKQANAQDLRTYIQNLRNQHAFGKDTYQIGKVLRSAMEDGLSNTLEHAAGAEGVEALQTFKQTQSEYGKVKGLLSELNDRLHLGKDAKYGVGSFIKALGAADGESVVNRLGLRNDVGLQQLVEKQFPEVADVLKKQELDTILKKSINKTGDALDLNKLKKHLDTLAPELRSAILAPKQLDKINALHELNQKVPQRLNPSGTARTLDTLWSKSTASTVAMAGAVLAHNPALGAVIGALGAHLTKEGPDAIRLAMLKFMGSNMPTSASGFASMAKIAKIAISGENKLNNAVEGVFKGGVDIAEPSKAELAKLSDHVSKLNEKPEGMLNIAGDIGHYMPEQAAIISMAGMRQQKYLQSLVPRTSPLAPLDSPLKVSKEDEAKYNNALKIAEAPGLILKAVGEGSLTTQDMQHLQNLHPELMQVMQQRLLTQLQEHKAKNGTIPYKTQLSLSAFLHEPLTTNMTPAAILGNQPQPKPAPMQQMSAAKGAKLSKLPQSSMTPDQTRLTNKANGH